MTELYNIDSIEIKGTKINKIATFYNKNFNDKNKIIPSVKCVEDIVSSMSSGSVKSTFDFNKQHQSNILNDELIVDGDYDMTYNTNITLNTDNTFLYPENCLNNCSHDRVYISSNVKQFDSDTNYELKKEKTLVEVPNSISVMLDKYESSGTIYSLSLKFINFEVGKVYTLKDYFFGSGSNLITFAADANLINFYKDELCTINYNGNTQINSEFVYFKPTSPSEYENMVDLALTNENSTIAENLFSINESETHKKITISGFKTNIINISNNNIKEIYVSDEITTIGFNITSSAYDGLKIYYNKCKFNSITDASNSHLYINSSGDLQNYTSLTNGPKNLHLSSSFFNNMKITSETSTYKNIFNGSTITTIYVKNNLNTKLTNEELLTQLKTILGFENIVLE